MVTMLHEIAHLVVGCQNQHNDHWRAMVHRLGGIPEECRAPRVCFTPQGRRRTVDDDDTYLCC
jgi:hypothetical protein